MYEERLVVQNFNPLDDEVRNVVSKLKSGSLTKLQFHSKKKYLKNKGDLLGVLKLAIAWEIVAFEEKHNEH